jgi:hypothetical protein
MFVTTPLGAKLEQQIFDEGEGGGRGTTSNINRNWDGVWDAAAKITPDGWTAEMAIPTNTVRFKPDSEQVWGINFLRHIRKKNEIDYWSPIPRAYTLTRVSMAGELRGLRDLSLGMDLKLKPFVLAGPRVRDIAAGNRNTSWSHDVGLDARYGVTAGLNLDVTINTDFAQVEVDDQQVNLTRFSLFFPEKRDFFLKDADLFDFGRIGGPGDSNYQRTKNEGRNNGFDQFEKNFTDDFHLLRHCREVESKLGPDNHTEQNPGGQALSAPATITQ